MTRTFIFEGVTYSVKRCVACGRHIELNKSGHPDHHCSDKFEAAVERLNRRAANDEFLNDIPIRRRLERLEYISG